MQPVHYCFSLLKLPRVATTKYQKLGDLEQQNVLLHISKTISLWSRWQSWFFWGVSFSYLFILNWRIIALQYCVGLCHTSTWISHRYMYVLSFMNLPLTLQPFWRVLRDNLFHASLLASGSFFLFVFCFFFSSLGRSLACKGITLPHAHGILLVCISMSKYLFFIRTSDMLD